MNKQPRHLRPLSPTTTFFLTLVATVSLIRIVLLIIFYQFTYTSYLDRIIEDPFHHYHAGVLALLLSPLVASHTKRLTIQSIAAGIIVEEHAVILSDMGISILGYFYLSGIDLAVAFIGIAVLYGLVQAGKWLKISF